MLNGHQEGFIMSVIADHISDINSIAFGRNRRLITAIRRAQPWVEGIMLMGAVAAGGGAYRAIPIQVFYSGH